MKMCTGEMRWAKIMEDLEYSSKKTELYPLFIPKTLTGCQV